MIKFNFFKIMAVSVLFLAPSTWAASPSIFDLPLKFQNQNGQTVQLKDLKGKTVVMTMTYSSCPFACPRIIHRVKQLQKNAIRDGKKAQYVVVSFDPERDTPQRLSKVQKESQETSSWMFLSGTESATRQLSMMLGIRYEKNPEDGNISHDNKIVILNEAGVIVKELNGLTVDPGDSL